MLTCLLHLNQVVFRFQRLFDAVFLIMLHALLKHFLSRIQPCPLGSPISLLCIFSIFDSLVFYSLDLISGHVFNVVPWLAYIPLCIFSGWISDRLISEGVSVARVRKGSEFVALIGTGLVLLFLPTIKEFHVSLFLVSLALALFSCHAGGHNANSLVWKVQCNVCGMDAFSFNS